MTNLKSFLSGLTFLINIVLYPIWMLGFILGMINDPPKQNYSTDYISMVAAIIIVSIGLFAWTIMTLSLMSKIIS